MSDNTRRVAIDAGAFLVVLTLSTIIFDNFLIGLMLAFVVSGGVDHFTNKKS